MTPLLLIVLQSVQDVKSFLNEFGVTVSMLLVMTAAFFGVVWYAARHVLPALQEGYQEQIKQLRADHKEDRDRDSALMAVLRTEFLAALDRRDKTIEGLTLAFQGSLDRVERHCQQQVEKMQAQNERVCQRLDALTAAVQAMSEREG